MDFYEVGIKVYLLKCNLKEVSDAELQNLGNSMILLYTNS
jgi:hypothetical protein